MAVTRRQYSNTAAATTLTGDITASSTSVTVNSVTGYPSSFPFTAAIGRATASEELVLVTAVASNTFTVTRGYGGTTGKTHSTGAAFEHVVDATDADEANAHVNAASGVHSATGSVVGTTDTQTLTNKILSSSKGLATSTDPALKAQAASSGSAALITAVDSAGTTTLFNVAKAGGVSGTNVAWTNDTAATVALAVKGAASQSANLVTIQDSTPHTLATVDKDGKVAVNPFVDNATPLLKLKNPAAGTTANPLEVQTSGGTVVARIGPAGDYVATGFTLNDNGGFDRLNTADTGFRVTSTNQVFASNMGGKVGYASTTSGSATTSSGAEALMATLNVTFTSVTSRLYRIRVKVRCGGASTTSDVKVRHSGTGSAPTTSSTLVDSFRYVSQAFATTNEWSTVLTGTVSGSDTVGISVTRVNGTGESTIDSAAGLKAELEITDIGT